MNMPKVDTYGTQQPIALLLFLVGRGCMYDRKKDLDLRTYKDLEFIGAMGPPGGGRNNVDPRFVRLFTVFNLTPPSEEVLKKIYGSIITRFAANFNDKVQAAAAKVTDAMLRLFDLCIEKLPPTPSKFHYIFNLRPVLRHARRREHRRRLRAHVEERVHAHLHGPADHAGGPGPGVGHHHLHRQRHLRRQRRGGAEGPHHLR